MQKDIPLKKFRETLSFVLPAKITVSLIVLRTAVLAGRTKLRVSQNFFRGYLFVFVEYLCNRSTKIKTKTFQKLDGSLPANRRKANAVTLKSTFCLP